MVFVSNSWADTEFVTNFTPTRFFNNLFTQKTRKLRQTYIRDKTMYIVYSYSKPSSNIINEYKTGNQIRVRSIILNKAVVPWVKFCSSFMVW